MSLVLRGTTMQGRSQGGSEGSAGIPPPPPHDIHDQYCYALEKLRAEMYTIHILFMLIQHILRIS